jgi:hypothetical protein
MSNPIPKNIKECDERIARLSREYLQKRGTARGSAIEKELYALKAWKVANK